MSFCKDEIVAVLYKCTSKDARASRGVFNLVGFTGVGVPISAAYFLGVKPTLNANTQRLKSDPAYLRQEFNKSISTDPRFGGPK